MYIKLNKLNSYSALFIANNILMLCFLHKQVTWNLRLRSPDWISLILLWAYFNQLDDGIGSIMYFSKLIRARTHTLYKNSSAFLYFIWNVLICWSPTLNFVSNKKKFMVCMFTLFTPFRLPSLDLSHWTFFLNYVAFLIYVRPHFALQHSLHLLQEMHILVSLTIYTCY